MLIHSSQLTSHNRFLPVFLMLGFYLGIGFLINNGLIFQPNEEYDASQRLEDITFMDELRQAMQDIKVEVEEEKNTLNHLVEQVEDMFNQVDLQRQKLQLFIDTTRSQLNINQVENPENIENNQPIDPS